jgi:hypothetical protein
MKYFCSDYIQGTVRHGTCSRPEEITTYIRHIELNREEII